MAKDSALAGVDMHLANPDATPEASHESWLAQKIKDGWKYGPEKDAEKKLHPCICEYAELPVEQKAKDYLFRAVVHALKDAPNEAPAVKPIKVSDSGNVSIKYVGSRAEYTDGTYGTRITFIRGESRMVPLDKARLMLKHPDVYVPGEDGAEVAHCASPKDEADDVQDVRDAIGLMDKDALTTYVKTHFNMDIDKRKGIATLRTEVVGLVDRFGVQ